MSKDQHSTEDRREMQPALDLGEEFTQDTDVEAAKSILERIIDVTTRDVMPMFGVIVVIIFILVAIFAPFIAPHDPDATFQLMQEPNSYSEGDFSGDGEIEQAYHLLGTDSLGHDLLTRIIFGTRISLLVAIGVVLFSFTVGTSIGVIAGYYGGWVDDLLMRYIDFQWAFPSLVLAVGIVAFLGGLGVENVILAIGIAYIDDFARLIRGEVLSIRENEYITAANAIGMSDFRIMTREVLPNAVSPLIVQTTLMIPLAILAESSLSFIGLGVSPATPTWGLLIGQGRNFLTQAWWVSIFPGFAIMIVVLGFNMFGDALRDAFSVEEVMER